MEKQFYKKFIWVIKNFSSLQSDQYIYSDQFLIGSCKWRLKAKENNNHHDLSLYLEVADSKSLPFGWRRHAKVSFTIVNQIPANLSQMRETQHWFNEREGDWGFSSMFPLHELKAKNGGFLVNGNVKIVAEIDVLEVVGILDVSEKMSSVKENMDVNGVQVLPAQVEFVNRLFERYPDIASKFCPKNPHLKTAYMNVLLSLTVMLRQSPEKISKDDLVDSYAALGSVTDAGFKLGWLEKKLDELSEKKEKEEACEMRILKIEVELKDLKQKCSDLETLLDKEKAELLAARAPLLCDDVF